MEINDGSVGESVSEEEIIDNPGNRCIECGKTLTSFSNMLKHIRRMHSSTVNIKIDYRKSLICPICNAELISKKSYEEHLLSDHDTKLDKINLEFISVEDFSEWKKTTERKNHCMYVKRSGTKKNSIVNIEHFYCHRSGDYRKCGTGQRKLKKKGSNKIEKTCPSKMKVLHQKDKVTVEYVKTHIGHSFDIERMKINEEERKSIALKLASGMTASQVLASIEKPSCGNIEPIHTITRKDVLNIRKMFNIPLVRDIKTKKPDKRSKNKDVVVLEKNQIEINSNENNSAQNISSEIINIHSVKEPEQTGIIYCCQENNPVQNDSNKNIYQNSSCQITVLNNREELAYLFSSLKE